MKRKHFFLGLILGGLLITTALSFAGNRPKAVMPKDGLASEGRELASNDVVTTKYVSGMNQIIQIVDTKNDIVCYASNHGISCVKVDRVKE